MRPGASSRSTSAAPTFASCRSGPPRPFLSASPSMLLTQRNGRSGDDAGQPGGPRPLPDGAEKVHRQRRGQDRHRQAGVCPVHRPNLLPPRFPLPPRANPRPNPRPTSCATPFPLPPCPTPALTPALIPTRCPRSPPSSPAVRLSGGVHRRLSQVQQAADRRHPPPRLHVLLPRAADRPRERHAPELDQGLLRHGRRGRGRRAPALRVAQDQGECGSAASRRSARLHSTRALRGWLVVHASRAWTCASRCWPTTRSGRW